LPELLRLVREEEPPKPSTRLGEMEESLAAIAARRQTEPARLRQQVRGELDWIVMKALEKDRTRRYESAGGLARDIERYLNDEPVEACPPSAAYRLRKRRRRHKGPVVAAALVLLTLVAGAVGTAWGLVRALDEGKATEKARQQAVENEEKAREEADRAREAEADTRAYATFLANHILAASRPEGLQLGVGHDVSLADALAKAEPKIAEVFCGRPKAEALARHEIGVTWRNLGRVDRAEVQLRQAIALRKQELGPDHLDTLKSRNSLGLLLAYSGRALEAIPLLEDVRARHDRAGRSDHPEALTCLNNLAEAYRLSGQTGTALLLFEQTLPKWETTFGPEHVDAPTMRNNLALTYLASGRPRKAVPLLEHGLKENSERLGPDHPRTLGVMNNLATGYEQAGRLDKLLPLRKKALNQMKATFGADHPVTLKAMNNLAEAYRADGQLNRALGLYDKTLKLMKADDPTTFVVMSNQALAYGADGKPDQAAPLFREAAEGMEKLRFRHEHAWRVVYNLCDHLDRSGQFGEAEAWRRKGLALVKKQFGADSVLYANHLASLGLNLLFQQKWADAEAVLRGCLAIREKEQPDAWTTFNTQSLLGGALLAQKKYDQTEPLLLKGYEGLKQRADTIPEPGKARLTEALERLVRLYNATDRRDKAAEYHRLLKEAAKREP
jgi:non-specific serine/threonine protein kinase/serine/threonine-protein kinase